MGQVRFSAFILLMQAQGWAAHVAARTPTYSVGPFEVQCVFEAQCRGEFLRVLGALRSYPDLLWLAGLGPLIVGVVTLAATWPKPKPPFEAHWADLGQVRRYIVPLQTTRPTLYLGKLSGRFLGIQARPKRRERLPHGAVIAPTQTGKSLHATWTLLTFLGSVVVVDIKGELFERTSGARRRLGPVYVLDPTGAGHRYDPVAATGHHPRDLGAVARILLTDPQDRDPIFVERATPAVKAALYAAALQDEPGLPYLRALVRQGPKAFIETLQCVPDSSGTISGYLRDYLQVPPETMNDEKYHDIRGFLSASWATLGTRLEAFDEDILAMMGGEGVQATDLTKQITTLYLRWPEKLLRSTQRPLELVLTSLITALLDAAGPTPNPASLPVLFLLDELPQYPMSALPRLISTMQGRSLSTILYLQSTAQLSEAFGRESAQILWDNLAWEAYAWEAYYQPTFESAKRISERLGQMTLEDKRVSSLRGLFQQETVSRGDRPRVLATPDELLRLPEDEAILLMRGERPVKAKRLLYYKEREIKRRSKLPPVVIPQIPQVERVKTSTHSYKDLARDVDPDDASPSD